MPFRYTYWLAICSVLLGITRTAVGVPITINPKACNRNFDLLDWDVKWFGPYVVCLGGTVTFQWRGMHGVFQVPNIACPSNYTSGETENYKFLAPVSNGGRYEWEVPNKTGHYWITSQHQDDCQRGMLAEVYVVDIDDEPFLASAPGLPAWQLVLASIASATILMFA